MVWIAVLGLVTLFILGAVSFHIFRSLRDGAISGRGNALFSDFTFNKKDRPIPFWLLIGLYVAILAGVVVSMLVPVITEIIRMNAS
jgi:hypothetical protein